MNENWRRFEGEINGQIVYKASVTRERPFIRTNDFANHPSGASLKRGHAGAAWTSGEAALLLRPPALGLCSGQFSPIGG
ncbi:MAG: hypothetical protein H0Z34_12725 [Brevibacillus sp.]|nr:hypothetical protein [Brevibacillus sp.]